MEEVIVSLIEKSLVGAAFIYMLYFFLGQFSTSLQEVGKTLNDVSQTLLKMNTRLDNIERRMNEVERKEVGK